MVPILTLESSPAFHPRAVPEGRRENLMNNENIEYNDNNEHIDDMMLGLESSMWIPVLISVIVIIGSIIAVLIVKGIL